MSALLVTADDCPSCGRDHLVVTDWPRCPVHRHWLYELRVTDAGWTYACQAPYCRYTHTQPERATMTATAEAATAALAIRDGQREWDGKQLAALAQLSGGAAPEAELAVFFHYCQATGLDPFARQIRLRKDRSKNSDGEWEDRWSIETEIDGYRVIAHRAARRDGVDLSYGPTYWYDRAGGKHELWLGDEPPAGASVTVYKDSRPFPGVVRFKSFAKYKTGGQLMAQWATMPDHMIAKCAEAQALRKAFPHDLGEIRTSEEAHVTAPQVTVTQEPPRAAPAAAAAHNPSRSNVASAALRTAISRQFDRLGLDDPDERKVYVYRLASKDGADELTEHDLRFALASIKDCEDIGQLQELLSPSEPAAS